MLSEKQSNEVELLKNGRLFPIWVLHNFKQYKLPEIFQTGEDACAPNITSNKEIEQKFRTYQLFVSKFLNYRSSYKDILIYHGLGSGKTGTAINVYNILYNSTPGWNLFILIKASLQSMWEEELKRWLQKDEQEYRMKNIIFIHYDSPFANREFMEAVRISDSSKKNIYIIEECHNFIRNVYSNISTNKGKRAQEIYDYIIQDKKENESSRVILLSGTPAINNPFELSLLFNLLRPNVFPKSESQFNQLFINQSTGEINPAAKNMFQRRILGLVSYYIGATPDYYASQSLHNINVKMSEYQHDIYKFYEELEAKSLQRKKGKSESYRTYTRQACNFVFPNIPPDILGQQRPRPSKFRISDKEAEKLAEGRIGTKEAHKPEQVTLIKEYMFALNKYVDAFDNYLEELNIKDIDKKHTLINDIEIFKNQYKGKYDDFIKNEKIKSNVYNAMYNSSPKMLYMLFNAMLSQGPLMIYSNYVIMEGLQLIKIYLKYFGFTKYGTEVGKDKFRYMEYSGSIDRSVREAEKVIFNREENKYGNTIKIFLLSPAAAEGLTLYSIRQIHILEPYWHEVRIIQTIGRGIRQCSHKYLPMNERHVDVFRYKSMYDDLETADQYVETKAKNRDRLITSFLNAIKESAVDCELNYAHNKLNQNIECFQFNEPSLLGKQFGPAYKKDILDDVNMDNGSNSLKSSTIKIRVIKISAVKKLSEDTYSKPENYWYYPESGVVYDFNLHYQIGQVQQDEDNNPIKNNQNHYIIDKVIPIPQIKQSI
jgi:superfamily II DNA or RNA helicase